MSFTIRVVKKLFC